MRRTRLLGSGCGVLGGDRSIVVGDEVAGEDDHLRDSLAPGNRARRAQHQPRHHLLRRLDREQGHHTRLQPGREQADQRLRQPARSGSQRAALPTAGPECLQAPFERAAEAGAVVVELYNPNSTAPGSIYEGSRGAGEDAVQLVAEEFPDGSTALVIGGPPIPAVTERTAGFTDNAEANGIRWSSQADNLKDNVEDARMLADDLLTQAPRRQRHLRLQRQLRDRRRSGGGRLARWRT